MITWGVIIEKGVQADHLKGYARSLESGHIGSNAAIKRIGKNIYEIRPKGSDGRLLGSAYRDNECYNALKRYMPLEDALAVSRIMENSAAGNEIRLIAFSKTATKHEYIGEVKEDIILKERYA